MFPLFTYKNLAGIDNDSEETFKTKYELESESEEESSSEDESDQDPRRGIVERDTRVLSYLTDLF